MIGNQRHSAEPISRAASIGLVVILVMVCLPLAPVLPPGTLIVVGFVIGWRIWLLRGRGQEPGRIIRVGMVILSTILVLHHYQTLLGLEAGAAILVAAYTLKLLEMRYRRDAFTLGFLGFFVVVTGLLFTQSLLMTVYLLCCLVALVSILVGLQQPATQTSFKPALKTGLLLTMQALPLMAILFVLVPRLPPMWTVPLPNNSSRTGLSDEMSPGDIVNLSKSDALAFRATFTGDLPPANQRYWRAVVMYWFNGYRWSQGNEEIWRQAGVQPKEWISWFPKRPLWPVPEQEDSYSYNIILEPDDNPWLPVLGSATRSISASGLTRDGRLQAKNNITLLTRYSQTSGGTIIKDTIIKDTIIKNKVPPLPDWLRKASLQLPKQGNERARRFAEQLKARYGDDSDALAQALLTMFRTEKFYYTLRPPPLTEDTIDSFLFDTMKGFCAHYAGAMVFVLRAAGIPARVVAGYQGGEEKEGGLIQVRKFDAHAWVEYWQPKGGWTHIDPTAAVSPARITMGLEAAMAEEGSFLEESQLSPLMKYRHINWVNTLRLRYELLEYKWQRLILSYNEESQQNLFGKLFPEQNTLSVLLWLLAASIIIVTLVTLLFLMKPWQSHRLPADRYYLRFCKRMARKGVNRRPGEGPETYARRIAQKHPRLANRTEWIINIYIRLAYGRPEAGDLRELRRLTRRFY